MRKYGLMLVFLCICGLAGCNKQAVEGIDFPFEAADVVSVSAAHYTSVSAEAKVVTETADAAITTFQFHLSDDTEFNLFYAGNGRVINGDSGRSEMKYTYRDEYYYGYLEDRVSIAHVVIWTALGLYANDVLLLRIIFFCLAVGFGINGYITATKRYKKAMAFRDKMMKHGYRCIGKVINAGGEKESINHEYYDDDGIKKDFSTTRPNYWVEVEYSDSKDGQVKQARGERFGKKTKSLIGRRADVYLYKESIYIDIP